MVDIMVCIFIVVVGFPEKIPNLRTLEEQKIQKRTNFAAMHADVSPGNLLVISNFHTSYVSTLVCRVNAGRVVVVGRVRSGRD